MATIVEDSSFPATKPSRSRLPGRSLSLLLLLPLLAGTIWCAGQLGLQVVSPPIPPIHPVRTADYQPWPYDTFSAINPLLVTLIAQQDGTPVGGVRVASLPTVTAQPTNLQAVLAPQTQSSSPGESAVTQANSVDSTQVGSLTNTLAEPTATAPSATPSATTPGTATDTATRSPSMTSTISTVTNSASPTASGTASPSRTTRSATTTRSRTPSPTRTVTTTRSRTPSPTRTATAGQLLNAMFAASPPVGPAPLTVTFTNLSTGPITSYFWSFGDGVGFSAVASPNYTYANPGTYTVSLTAFDSGGGMDSASSLIIVGALPTATGTSSPMPPTSTSVVTVPTSTFTSIPPTFTYTPVPPTNTLTWTPSLTPSFTPTFSRTWTPSITPTPSNTFTPRPTSAPGSACPQWDEPDIGAPDGNFCDLGANQQYIFDLSGNPIVTQPGYDFVFYEYGYPGPPPYVLMDWRYIDVGTTSSGPWVTVFNWGDDVADTNSNVGAAGYGAGGEANDASVPMSVLYGTPPLQTGIAIDVDPIAGAGTYPYVRVRSYNTASNLEAVGVIPSAGPTATYTPSPTFTPSPTATTSPVADLSLSMIVSNANPILGTNITYTITLTNNSPDTATNIQVADALPAGLSFVSSAPSQGSYGGGVWTVGTVPGSANATLSLTATVVGTPGSGINNSATITASDLPDPNAGNNSASAPITIQITPVDLTLGLSVDNPNPADGSAITYTLVIMNTNVTAAVGGVQITNALDTGLVEGIATVSQGSYAANTWNVGYLPAGGSAFLTLPATVQIGYAGAMLNHTASIAAANQPDPNAGNNTAGAPIVVQSADLSVTISVDNPTPAQNATVVYTLNVTNNGPNTATGVVVNAPVPADVSYVGDDGAGAYDQTTWTVGTLANGANVTLNITALAETPTTVSFPVSIQPSEPGDTNPANDSDSVDIVVIPPPVAAFSVNPMSGEEPLQIAITNTSSGNITSYDWNFGDGVGTSTQQNPPDYVYTTPNTYDVTLTVTGPGGSDVEMVQVTVVLRVTDVSVTVSADNPTPPPGGTVIYTVQVTNNGPKDTTGVVATLNIPPELTVNSATPAQGSYAGGVWTLDPIAASTTQTLTLNTTVGALVPPSTMLDVSATLSTPNHNDSNAGNNSDTETITVQ